MPTTTAAAKAYRQNLKARARNAIVKHQLKKLQVRLRKALTANQTDQVKTVAQELVRAYDKAAQKKVITRNTAARKKSRLAAALRSA
ncbi:MAG: 30S ribosomal protein S20 [Patescibacteria group bacterium]